MGAERGRVGRPRYSANMKINDQRASSTAPQTFGWPRLGKALLVLAIIASFGVWCIGLPAQAGSLASSAASSALDSLSTSVGVFSNAVSGVSTSSSPGGGKVAQGDYRIERARAVEGLTPRVALGLQPTDEAASAGARPWKLQLPAGVATDAALEPGQLLTVRERPYGFGLWRAGADQPFYLVVHDDWAQALQARPIPAR